MTEKYVDIKEVIKGNCPLALWKTNVDVRNLDDFENWLASQAKQMLEMQIRFMDEETDSDELITHCASKGNAFLSALYTYRLAKAKGR